jgi:hypothetical protein
MTPVPRVDALLEVAVSALPFIVGTYHFRGRIVSVIGSNSPTNAEPMSKQSDIGMRPCREAANIVAKNASGSSVSTS